MENIKMFKGVRNLIDEMVFLNWINDKILRYCSDNLIKFCKNLFLKQREKILYFFFAKSLWTNFIKMFYLFQNLSLRKSFLNFPKLWKVDKVVKNYLARNFLRNYLLKDFNLKKLIPESADICCYSILNAIFALH